MSDKTELQTDVSATHGLSSTEGESLSDLLYWRTVETAPIGVDVLVFDGINHFAPAWVSGISGQWLFGNSQPCSPTHWMPLPKPPKAI